MSLISISYQSTVNVKLSWKSMTMPRVNVSACSSLKFGLPKLFETPVLPTVGCCASVRLS